MEEKKYAYYVSKKEHKSVRNAIISGHFDCLRIAEYTQKEGNDVSYHGSPFYETLSTLVDVDTKEKFHHNDYDQNSKIDFIKIEHMSSVLDHLLKVSQEEKRKLFKQLYEEDVKQENIKQAKVKFEQFKDIAQTFNTNQKKSIVKDSVQKEGIVQRM